MVENGERTAAAGKKALTILLPYPIKGLETFQCQPEPQQDDSILPRFSQYFPTENREVEVHNGQPRIDRYQVSAPQGTIPKVFSR